MVPVERHLWPGAFLMPHHELHSSPATTHWGFLDASVPPVLRVASGDEVTVHCVSGGPESLPASGFALLPEHLEIHRESGPKLGPHILTGPVYVEDAEIGDTLEIRILDIRLRQDWGWNMIRPLFGTLPEDFPLFRMLHIALDRSAMEAVLPWGTRVPLRPFFGVLAVAPLPVYGAVSSVVPREFGGNLDNKELTVGSSLFLPVFNKGALFSAGDGHAVQGDGEVCLTALETALTGRFQLIVRKDLRLKFPRAETPTHHITMGLDLDLDDAAKQALREMIALIQEVSGISAVDAYSLCSLACDLHVTQLVDGNKGIHAMLPKALVPRAQSV